MESIIHLKYYFYDEKFKLEIRLKKLTEMNHKTSFRNITNSMYYIPQTIYIYKNVLQKKSVIMLS